MGFSTAGVTEALTALTATTAVAGTIMSATRKGPAMPPSPVVDQSQLDQSEQDAKQQAMKRQAIAGGLNSTIGTSGGQAGAVLNPGNMGGKTLLGE